MPFGPTLICPSAGIRLSIAIYCSLHSGESELAVWPDRHATARRGRRSVPPVLWSWTCLRLWFHRWTIHFVRCLAVFSRPVSSWLTVVTFSFVIFHGRQRCSLVCVPSESSARGMRTLPLTLSPVFPRPVAPPALVGERG